MLPGCGNLLPGDAAAHNLQRQAGRAGSLDSHPQRFTQKRGNPDPVRRIDHDAMAGNMRLVRRSYSGSERRRFFFRFGRMHWDCGRGARAGGGASRLFRSRGQLVGRGRHGLLTISIAAKRIIRRADY